MDPQFTFLVSQPSCSKAISSGYGIFQFRENRIVPLKVDTSDEAADTNSIVQKFCYLRPKSMPIIPSSEQSNNQEHSDYLVIARNHGVVEIIKDYQFKISNNIPLRPDFLLFCVPMVTTTTTNDMTIVGLEYKDKLLYVCSATGDIFGFVLNLPDGYVQEEEFQAPPSYEQYRDSFSWKLDTKQSPDATRTERALKALLKFKKEHNFEHICYYCYPVNNVGFFRETIKEWYPEPIPTFSNFFVTSLRTDVTSFRINPMDRFSVITASPQIPLTIHKVLLPEIFPSFFGEFVNLKDEYFSQKPELVSEPPTLDFMSRAMHGIAFQEYLRRESSTLAAEQQIKSWKDIQVCDVVCDFKSSSVWRQKQGDMKDSLYHLFFYDKSQNDNRDRSDPSDGNEPIVNFELDPESYSLVGIPTESSNNPSQQHPRTTQAERFVKFLRKQTFPVNFQVVKTVSLNGESKTTDFEATTSFLTDAYSDMDVVMVDKFLSIDAFRPKFIDEPLMKLDFIHDYAEIDEEDENSQVVLNNLSSFVKFFMLSDSLCMIWDVNGILLVDRFQLRNTRNLLRNEVGVVKLVDFRVGIVNDIGLVLSLFEKNGSDYHIQFYSILTSVTGAITVLKGEFKFGERLGNLEILDKLEMENTDKFADQLLITNFKVPNKRESGTQIPLISKVHKR
ncbi:unnamed protein product [Kluyveromyces dobzhanskii CBS 2104]|uniref:WGS project CCBQ000000000 data, contig 00015 n=1 Tax=Kluyveromyces dobzhanskii CBS 2104 TaxID=1427455 RepID=A0A0A8L9I9_9SACH|nr:unnamed protein product [Kluyveromyces dobzhanskii CBS 2104]